MKNIVLEPISARKWRVSAGRKIIRVDNFAGCLNFALKNLEGTALKCREARNEHSNRTKTLSLR